MRYCIMSKASRLKSVVFNYKGGVFSALELCGRSWILLVSASVLLVPGMTLTIRAQSDVESYRMAVIQSVANPSDSATTEVRLRAPGLTWVSGVEEARTWGLRKHR